MIRRRLIPLTLAALAAALWFLLAPADGDVTPPEPGEPRLMTTESATDSNRAVLDLVPLDGQRIAVAPRQESPVESSGSHDPEDPVLSVRGWTLHFRITSPRGISPQALEVGEPDGSKRTARLDPATGEFHAPVVGTREELEVAPLAISSGRGAAARRSVIALADYGVPDATGVLDLRTATWDTKHARILAGTVHLETPPRLGRLILEPGGVGGVTFEITSNGTKGPLKTTVEFPEGSATRDGTGENDEVELGTFLPATEWTAKLVGGTAMRSSPDWKKTAPAGEDIVVKLTDTGGVRIKLSSRHIPSFGSLAIVRLPSPLEDRMTLKELTERTQAQSTPTVAIGFGGAGFGDPSTRRPSYLQVAQRFLDPGDYRIEAWGDEDGAGVLRLLTSSLVTVGDVFIEVTLD